MRRLIPVRVSDFPLRGVDQPVREVMKSAVRMVVGKPAREPRAIHPVPARPAAKVKLIASPALDSPNLDSFVAEAAHDLNNALGAVRLHLDLLDLEVNYPRRVRQRTLEIRYALDHAEDISRTLRNPAAGCPASSDPIPKTAINPVLRRMLPLMSAMVPKNITLQISLIPKLNAVRIEPVDLVRIVSNLMHNSLVAMRGVPHAKGKLAIETANTPGWVLVRVRDNGPGMPAAVQAQLMRPFVANVAGQHGVGLPSVLRLVRRAGGILQIESVPGQGTVVTILFPAAASSQIDSTTMGPKHTPLNPGPKVP